MYIYIYIWGAKPIGFTAGPSRATKRWSSKTTKGWHSTKVDAPKTPPKDGTSAPPAPKFQRLWHQQSNQQKKMSLQRRRQLFPACPQLCQWHHRLRPSWNPFRRLHHQRPNQKNKELPLQSPHQQSRLQLQNHWCQSRSLALKAMTHLQRKRRRSRCPSRLRPSNVNVALPKRSKVSWSVTFVDWCAKERARPTGWRSQRGESPPSTS